jgi:hypothetical protein
MVKVVGEQQETDVGRRGDATCDTCEEHYRECQVKCPLQGTYMTAEPKQD